MPRFQTPEPITATLDFDGDARIIAGDRHDTLVEITPRDASNPEDVRAAEDARVEYSDGKLLLKTIRSWKRYLPNKRGGLIEVVVGLPAGSALEVTSGFGTLRMEGRLADCTLKTGMGNIHVERAASASLTTGYGDVVADRIDGNLDVTSGSGEIRIGSVTGNAQIRNSNGNTTVDGIGGDLQVKAANGPIMIGTARHSVRAKTANGRIRIGSVERGSIELDTAIGELAIGVREGSAAWLDAGSHFGNVRSTLDTINSPQSGDNTVEIHAHTAVGDIVITRAVTGAATDEQETVE